MGGSSSEEEELDSEEAELDSEAEDPLEALELCDEEALEDPLEAVLWAELVENSLEAVP